MKLKPIAGYEGIASIREDGMVRLHDRISPTGKLLKAKWIKPHANRDGGYLFVKLPELGGKRKNFYIHRLVASAFVANNCKGDTVNHIDGNKQNNSPNNLEWLSHIDNCHHAKRMGLLKPSPVSERNKFLIRNL